MTRIEQLKKQIEQADERLAVERRNDLKSLRLTPNQDSYPDDTETKSTRNHLANLRLSLKNSEPVSVN